MHDFQKEDFATFEEQSVISFECGELCSAISPCVDPWLPVVMKICGHAFLFSKDACMVGSVRAKAWKPE